MTTAPLPPSTSPRPVRVSPQVRIAGGTTLVLAAVTVVVAGLVSGSPGAVGAGIGAVMVLVFFGFGALTVDAVATISPAASLLVALLTYTLQVVAIGLVFAALDRSGALGSTVDAGWVGGTVIVATFTWLGAQIIAATRSRQPLYDLPADQPRRSSDRPRASAP